MKKKISAAIALVICLCFALSGCGVVNKNYSAKISLHEITVATDLTEGLTEADGALLKKVNGNSADYSTAFVVTGKIAEGGNAGKIETRVYDYGTGDNVLTVTDTADNNFLVREVNDFGRVLYVYSTPTDEKLADGTNTYTHVSAIYTRSGMPIIKKEVTDSSMTNTIELEDLFTSYVFNTSNGKQYFLRTTEGELWEFGDDGDAVRVATGMPVYNNPVAYDYKVNGYYYVLKNSDTTVTVYDGNFNIVRSTAFPIGANKYDVSAHVLSGGKLLYQITTVVPDNEKSYDITIWDSGDDKLLKCNVETYVLDPIKGKTKKINNGYYITRVYNRIDNENEMFDVYSDDVENIAVALRIKDKTVSYSDFDYLNVGNDGKIGGSVSLVDYQNEPVTTYDGSYFFAEDMFGCVTVFDKDLKKVVSYNRSVLDSYQDFGVYLYDEENRIVYDRAFKKIYEAKKDEKGDFVEVIELYSINDRACRIATIDSSVDGVKTFCVVENGVRRELKSFPTEENEVLVVNGGYTDYYGRDYGAQFWCVQNEATGKYTYYNFDGKVLFESDNRLYGYSVVGGCVVLTDASSHEYRLLR